MPWLLKPNLKQSTSTSIVFLSLLFCGSVSYAQTTPGTLPGGNQKDTSQSKTNNGKWKDEEARMTYERLNSKIVYYPDTSLHTFQRNHFLGTWYRDLGNLGSPANNLMFTPEERIGPSLGYHVYDVYRFKADSLNYYNTTRPYSVFNYQLGSKLEQTAGIMHSQNVKPNWNITAEYHKTNSPGFYKTQRNNNDNACLSSNYKSLDKHYTLYFGMVYNKEQHDENGGIVEQAQLNDPVYSDRKTLDAAYQSPYYNSNTRSTVSNALREFTLSLLHTYTWGRTDTAYNKDSTQYSYKLVPRFSVSHSMQLSTEKHSYKDLTPDSMRYLNLFTYSFLNKGNGYYAPFKDSVFTQQKWFWIDNKILLNGFLGKADNPLAFSVGIGNRYDQFISRPISVQHFDTSGLPYYTIGSDKSSIVSNYVVGEIKKEALKPGEWAYGINTKFIFTGDDAGNLVLNAAFGKQLKKDLGSFVIGVKQEVNSAPYSFTNYENQYTKNFYHFNKESVTGVFATLESPKLRLSGGLRNYIIGNYIYVNDSERPDQYSGTFNITQLWIRKVLRFGYVFLDNEIVYQQLTNNAPVNVPALMGRHQLSIEKALFRQRLKIASGLEVRYNTAYHPAGYDAVLNKFFYQNTTTVANVPECAVFLNFRIKRFRAFVMGDNLQQIFVRNAILYTGPHPSILRGCKVPTSLFMPRPMC